MKKSSLIRLASSLPVDDPNRARLLERVGRVIEDEYFGDRWESHIHGLTIRSSRIKEVDDLWETSPNGVFLSFEAGGHDLEWTLDKAEFETFKKEMKAMIAYLDSPQSY